MIREPQARAFALVIVNYASHDLIARNTGAEVARRAGAQVFLVDNQAGHAERDAARALCAERDWVFVPQRGNPGFAAGVNTGVRAAREAGHRVFVTLNPDARAVPEALASLARGVRDHPGTLASPLIEDGGGGVAYRGSTVSLRTGRIRGGWIEGDDDPEWKNWLSGACLAFDLETFEELGGLDPSYFLYWEDVDFSRRAAAAGHPLVLRRDLTVTHDEGGTHNPRGTRAKSPTYYYHNSRNRLRFGRRFHDGNWGEWVMTTPVETWRIWTRGGRRQLFTSPEGALAAVRGAAVGIRGDGGTHRGMAPPRTLAPRRPGVGAAAHPRGGGHPGAVATAPPPRPRASTPHPEPPTGPLSGRTVLVAHPSPDLYGSDRVLLESVQALVDAGARVVTTVPADGPLVTELVRRGSRVRLCPTPVLRKAHLSARGLIDLTRLAFAASGPGRRLLREVAPDLVVVNTLTIPLWTALARRAGIPTLTHVHEAEKSAPTWVRRGLYAPLLGATRIVTNSRFSLRVLADTWGTLGERTAVIHNGVVGPTTPTRPRAALEGGPRLLFLGRLSPRKGPQVVVEALDLLRREGVPAHLTLLGSVFEGYEWFEEELRGAVHARGLDDSVDFLGFDPDIWAHMADADIIVVPSTVDEPFGNTAVEAMLAQRPLIVSRTSGLKQASVAYASVRRVKPGSARSLAKAVTSMVGQWDRVRSDVEDDRRLALDRHAPHLYRARFLEEVLDLFTQVGVAPAAGGAS